MGMGYGANYTDMIDEKELAKVGKCGALLKELGEVLSASNLDDFAQAISQERDLDSEVYAKGLKVYEKLKAEFEEVSGGLVLALDYHSPEEGDRYDDVDGAFWSVGELYELSKAGKRFVKKYGESAIKRAFFVTFG